MEEPITPPFHVQLQQKCSNSKKRKRKKNPKEQQIGTTKIMIRV